VATTVEATEEAGATAEAGATDITGHHRTL
jgi:hypothetical protein